MVPTLKVNKLTVLLVVFSFLFSCSKDTDLLDDYSATENVDILDGRNFIKDDIYSTDGNSSIVLDVLSNDSFPDIDKVRIVRISNPSLGIVEIVDDKTIVYTPVGVNNESSNNTESNETTEEPNDTTDTSEENTSDSGNTQTNEESTENTEQTNEEGQADTTEATTDTFSYTAEATNEDGNTTTEEGSVTVEYSQEGTTSEQETTEEEDTADQPNPNIAENARYVTVNGRSSNDGLTENTSWSIEHAFNVARAGQTIYIKAGNYGNKELIMYQGGTSGNPIRFIGYQNYPEDIQTDNSSTFNYGDQIDSSKMPLFAGTINNSRGSGTSMRLTGDNVTFSNLQFTGYSYVISGDADNVTLKNIVTSRTGDFRPGTQGYSNYDGFAIRFKGNNVKILDSFILNAGAEGVALLDCDNCEVRNTEVASDNDTNPTDYYIILTGGTQNSLITNCVVRRKTGLSHFGHGIIGKAGASYNTISNCTAINTNIEMSFSDVHHNTISNCVVRGTFAQNGDVAGSLDVANGAHHNTFENIYVEGVWGAVQFRDWDEAIPSDQRDAGNNNLYKNISVVNSFYGILFSEFQKNESPATNNVFDGCTFDNLHRLIQVNRPNSGTKITNSTIRNVTEFWQTSPGFGYQLNSNTLFEGNTWQNNSFAQPN